MFSRFIYIVAHSFLTEYSIAWTYDILSIHKLMDIWVFYLCYCIQLLLWVMLLLTFMHKFLCDYMFPVFLSIYLEVQLLGRMVNVCLIIWGTAKLFSKQAVLFYTPTSSVWWLQLLHILTNTWYLLSFWEQPFEQVWGDSSLWFWLVFPWWLVMSNIFMYLLTVWIFFLRKCLFRSFIYF